MNHTFFLFKIFTDLSRMTALSLRDSIQLIYDINLSKAMTANLPSANDVLVTSAERLTQYAYFPGTILLLEENPQSLQNIQLPEQILLLSERGFDQSISHFLDLKYRVLKSQREKASMMNQLDLTIKEYNEAQTKLSDQEKSIENRLAMLNHELKTPLNIIQGHVGLLKSTPLNSQQTEYLNRIQKSAMFLNEAFLEILYYQDMMQEQEVMAQVPFNIDKAFEDIHQVYRSFAEEKGIGYEVFYDNRIYTQFIGDLMKLQLLIKQLISNALKFTAKGHIVFSVRCIEEMPKHQKLEMVVEDTGIGFDVNQFEAFFEPFRQGEHYLQRHYNGLGLGLTIVQNIVGAMNGTIDVWSSEGAGSRFVVTVTLEKDLSVTSKDLSKPTILVVDDNVLNRKILKEMLIDSGFAVELARNGKEAVEMISEGHPKIDLILMDLIMPVMDGFEATRRIRQFNETLPIIVLSASISEADIKRIEGFKIDDFVVKDHNLSQYLKVISKHISIPEQTEHLPESAILVAELKQYDFQKIEIDNLLQRFNYHFKLIHKVVEGLLAQMGEFKRHWDLLKLDPHDESVMRYLHSLKGLVRSVGDNSLAALIETVEKSKGADVLQETVYETLDQHLSLLRMDLIQIEQWSAANTAPSETDEEPSDAIEDVKAILESLVNDLKVHDVKQIRVRIAKIRDAKLDASCMDYLKPLLTLIDNYQYEQAAAWLQNAFEQWGDRSCLT